MRPPAGWPITECRLPPAACATRASRRCWSARSTPAVPTSASSGRPRPTMRARMFALLLAVVAFALAALAPPAEAQRGLGRGRNRQPEAPVNPQHQGGDQESPGPGEYGFGGLQVFDAINRGEGPQALAYYEKAAQEAEQQGNILRAAHALGAATTAAVRLGRYQKAIQTGTRALELCKKAKDPSPSDLMAWASVHSQLGATYRNVGDLTRATQVLEEGLQFANTRLTGRREGQVQGYLLNNLAMVAYAQHDYQTALARNTQASQYFQEWEATMGRRASESMRTKVRRWNAMSLYGIGRAQLALRHPDEAEAAFERSLKYARATGLHEIEVDILGGQANLAVSRKDWARAADLYQQSIALSAQLRRVGSLPNLYGGLARAYAELGRTDEALAASREAVRHVEDIRADLGDSDLRSGYFEGSRGSTNRRYSSRCRPSIRTRRSVWPSAAARGPSSTSWAAAPPCPRAAPARSSTRRCGCVRGSARRRPRRRKDRSRRSPIARARRSKRSIATIAPSSLACARRASSRRR